MSDVWIVIIKDRHDTDAEVVPFSSEERAITAAREYTGDVSLPDGITADEVMYVPGEQEISDAMREDGWVLWLVYSIEGDSVRVVRRTMDGDLPLPRPRASASRDRVEKGENPLAMGGSALFSVSLAKDLARPGIIRYPSSRRSHGTEVWGFFPGK